METKVRGGTLLRRKLESRRTKSLPKNVLSDPAELSTSIPPPAYERVALNTPSFHRPVILFGPLADVARSYLLSQFPGKFAEPSPSDYCGGGSGGTGGVIRLAALDSVIAAGKHCVLDISLESVERLQLAQYAPIVVLIDVDGRSRIREIRKKLNAPHVSSKKLAEQAAQIKKHHSHLLSATVDATNEEAWFDALRDLVIHLQQRRLWMPEFPPNLPLEDVLLFPLSSKSGNYDSDMESLKGDYSEYSIRREEGTNRAVVPQQMTRSIYEWDKNVKPIGSDGGCSSTDSPQHSKPPSGRHPNSPGYYHVKQLLNEESLYHDARLANEIANARLREEARIRDDKMRVEHRLHEKPQVPLQPPNSDMYSPREEKPSAQVSAFSNHQSVMNDGTPIKYPRGSAVPRPIIAPKPHVYTEGVVRNRWQDCTTADPITRIESPSLTTNVSVVTAQRQSGPNGVSNGNPSTSSSSNGHCQASEMARCVEASRNRSPRREDAASRNGRESAGNVMTTSDIQEPTIVEETSAVLGSEGGVLNCPVSGVELRIPKGAIPDGETHEIYVKVCRDGDSPPIDKSKGETLLSPLVMCGPQGLNFLTPCELRLPHCGPVEPDGQWSFSLKAGEGGEWQHMDVQPQKASGSSDKSFLSVLITHF
ncbi:ZU5 domain [Parelaphostrongylus tenuis]|uniref:ZU5 domain n=1 Tax=Parelaphostrongylus tenuis TaxID=148309 RepID=A0AAD5MRJ5_PARTN|nr:ZU5 domain [Parelaphostrongylus tenuis]